MISVIEEQTIPGQWGWKKVVWGFQAEFGMGCEDLRAVDEGEEVMDEMMGDIDELTATLDHDGKGYWTVTGTGVSVVGPGEVLEEGDDVQGFRTWVREVERRLDGVDERWRKLLEEER